jgi:hypothetical protein
MHFTDRRKPCLRMKGRKKDLSSLTEAGVAILTSDKVDFNLN